MRNVEMNVMSYQENKKSEKRITKREVLELGTCFVVFFTGLLLLIGTQHLGLRAASLNDPLSTVRLGDGK
jgi:hypothetical protein